MQAGTEHERETFYSNLAYLVGDEVLAEWAEVLERRWEPAGAPQGGEHTTVLLLVGGEEVEVSNRTIAAGYKVLNRMLQARRDADTEAVTFSDLDLLVQLGLYGRVRFA